MRSAKKKRAVKEIKTDSKYEFSDHECDEIIDSSSDDDDLEIRLPNSKNYEWERKRIESELLKSVGARPDLDLSGIDAMKVVQALEKNIDDVYKSFHANAMGPEFGRKLFEKIKQNCKSSNLPLMAEVRLESLLQEYEKKFCCPDTITLIDAMGGQEFENWCASLLEKIGFTNVGVTKASGDQGVDILAKKDGVKYAIQCKCYSNDLGNTPIQEVESGRIFYGCHVGAVITNRHFTSGAKDLAERTGTLLWDREWIIAVLKTIDATGQSEINTNDYLLASSSVGSDPIDEMLPQAADVVLETGMASVSMLQRRLKLGYARATRIMDSMEELGIVGPYVGSKPRDILITKEQWGKMREHLNI